MRLEAPFQADDLAEFDDRLLARALRVAPMRDVAAGATDQFTVGMRHDVDNSIEPAVALAEWEAVRGYRSTYFILPTAPYWEDKPLLERSLARIADCGHEIGYHLNAITAAIETGRDPLEYVADTLAELRGYGHTVTGVVAHGDPACYRHNFVNDELFVESPRPSYGPPSRIVGGVEVVPVSRATFGFDYDPNWLSRVAYLSDSGGRWSRNFDFLAEGFPYSGQLHILQHPDWWTRALIAEEVAA